MKQMVKIGINKGFTLVELVVVIVLLGVLAAFAIPQFFNLTEYRERAAYDEVAEALRYARQLAVASGCEVRVRITGGTYSLQQHENDCSSGGWEALTGHPVSQGDFDDVNLASTPATFNFDAMGRCSNSVTVNVGGRTISVVAETGYVNAP